MSVTDKILSHIESVRCLLVHISNKLIYRSVHHDESKLRPPEMGLYEKWKPLLDGMDIGGDEYRNALVQMGEALKHHYAMNRHHPEHFDNGIRGMNLIDVIEMVCDWYAAAGERGKPVNMKWAADRFGISEDEILYSIIQNTIEFLSEE